MRYLTLVILFLSVSAAVAAPPTQWVPVDQAVADLDPLAVGVRRIDPGLNIFGQQSSLFAVGQANADQSRGFNGPVTYYRIGPGFRAQVDRLDYVVPTSDNSVSLNIAPQHDGQFVELIPPNTVFDLRPQLPRAFSAAAAPANDARLNGRIEGRIDGRIDASVQAEVRNPR